MKLYGLRFLFILSGEGKKFDIVPTLVNLGSGLALLSVATGRKTALLVNVVCCF